jgi:hypothetical protein
LEKFEAVGLKYPLYRFVINPSARIKFCIAAGVHGYEIAGPLAMVDLFSNPKVYLDKNIGYYIYPVINPTAFDLRRRVDDDGFDDTLDKSTLRNKGFNEIRAFFNDVKDKKFAAFISLHEDVDVKKFYAYIFEAEPQKIYRQLIAATARHCQIWRTKDIYGTPADGQGLVINSHDRSLEDRLYCLQIAKISLCTETPGQLPLAKRIAINLNNIKLLNRHILKTK